MSAAINPARERLFATLPEVGEDAPIKYVIPLGRFCGTRIYDLPTAYLHWLVHEFTPYTNQTYWFAAAVFEYRRRRKAAA
jgi:hypothetical protein